MLVVERRLYEDGAARTNLRLVHLWRQARVLVQLYVLDRPGPGTPAPPFPPGVTPIYPARRPLRQRWALLLGQLRLVPLARGADVVLAGREVGYGVVVARVAALLARRPVAVLIQSDPVAAMRQYNGPRLRPLVARSLRTADRLICVSPGLVPTVEALGVDRSKISVAMNGVDVEAIRGAAASTAPVLPEGEGPLVVGLGRLVHQKGFDLLIEAHARVVAAGVPHRLLLLGDGPDRDALERLAERLGVSSSVHLPGFVPDPFPILAAADLHCLPSRWEGFGLTLAEALVVGTPIIAADCVSGPRDVLRDGAFGDLVPVDDVAALAGAIERHLREPARLRAVTAAGREWALANLDMRHTAERVLEILREVVSSARR